MRTAFIPCLLAIFMLNGCKQPAESPGDQFEYEELNTSEKEIAEVLYSMYLPTDMVDIFERSGTNFDPDVPAPLDDITLYQDPEQLAVMLGIYGVDIAYMKLLGQTQAAAVYYGAIETLSGRLGIPEEIFLESSSRLEEYFNHQDSLVSVIENIYRETDQFFRENGRENLAALSLVGGWLEAMYIGVNIFEADSGNQVMAERILQQKFSLNSIYVILSNHQESLSVKKTLLMLRKLRKTFEDVEIKFQKEGFSVDTTQKKIQTYNAQIRYDRQTMQDLVSTIPQVRQELIRVNVNE